MSISVPRVSRGEIVQRIALLTSVLDLELLRQTHRLDDVDLAGTNEADLAIVDMAIKILQEHRLTVREWVTMASWSEGAVDHV